MQHATSHFNLKAIAALFLGALLVLSSQLAQAHPFGRGWHGGGGVYFGAPYPFFPYAYSPYAYPYPYAYSPPPVVITQPQPQVYIEQDSGATNSGNTNSGTSSSTPPATSANNNAYWYYCEASDGYYPYVKECPAGWKQVTPTPPANTPAK